MNMTIQFYILTVMTIHNYKNSNFIIVTFIYFIVALL